MKNKHNKDVNDIYSENQNTEEIDTRRWNALSQAHPLAECCRDRCVESHLQSQCNPHQDFNTRFYGPCHDKSQLHMEKQKAQEN